MLNRLPLTKYCHSDNSVAIPMPLLTFQSMLNPLRALGRAPPKTYLLPGSQSRAAALVFGPVALADVQRIGSRYPGRSPGTKIVIGFVLENLVGRGSKT